MNFHDRLKDLREDSDLTQEQLASKLKITRSAINHYENSTREPDFEILIKIADLFDVSLDYLLCRTNKRY